MSQNRLKSPDLSFSWRAKSMKKVWPLTFDLYGSNKPSPECQFKNGKFKLRSITCFLTISSCCLLFLSIWVMGSWMLLCWNRQLNLDKCRVDMSRLRLWCTYCKLPDSSGDYVYILQATRQPRWLCVHLASYRTAQVTMCTSCKLPDSPGSHTSLNLNLKALN